MGRVLGFAGVMKICLLESKKAQSETNLPPLGLGYLASSLRSKEKNAQVFYEENLEKIRHLTPDLIGISSMTRNFGAAIEIARGIKQASDIPIVIGGVHLSALPESMPDCFDIGVVGDGEESFVEIVRSFSRCGRLERGDLSAIPGLVYRDHGALVQTGTRRLERILDGYPFPERDMFIGKGFLPYRTNVHMVTSRGCPFRCTFCYNKGAWGQYRYFSAPYVASELSFILDRYRPSSVTFIDDLFTGHLKRLKEVVRLMRAGGLHRRARYGCNSRANLMNEESVRLLTTMGVQEVFLGLESASNRVLSYLNKSGCTKEINQRAINLCASNRISVNANFIIGTPVETGEDLDETLQFIKENVRAFAMVTFGSLIPLPGTVFWDLAARRNLLGGDFELTRAMIERIDEAAFDAYNRKFAAVCAEVRARRKKIRNRLSRWRFLMRTLFWRGVHAMTFHRGECAR